MASGIGATVVALPEYQPAAAAPHWSGASLEQVNLQPRAPPDMALLTVPRVAQSTGSYYNLELFASPVPPTPVILGGTSLAGTFKCHLSKETKLRGARLRVRGTSHTYWETGSGKNRRTHTQTVVFFEQVIVFIGLPKGASGPDTVLQPGNYEWPFSFTLPTGIPPSFSAGVTGYTAYTAEGYLDVPWASDPTVVWTMSVGGGRAPLEFCSPASLQDAVKLSSFMCCGSAGSAELAMAIPTRAFPAMPAGSVTLPVQLSMANRSTKTIRPRISVERRTVFRAHGSRKFAVADAGSLTLDQFVQAPNSPGFANLAVTLPCDFSVLSFTSPLIDVYYALRFTAVVPWATNSHIELPICVEQPAVMMAAPTPVPLPAAPPAALPTPPMALTYGAPAAGMPAVVTPEFAQQPYASYPSSSYPAADPVPAPEPSSAPAFVQSPPPAYGYYPGQQQPSKSDGASEDPSAVAPSDRALGGL